MVLTEEERKERKRIRDKKYREKNKEKHKEYSKIHYQKNKEKRNKQSAEWAKNNREKCVKSSMKSHAKNPKSTFKAKWKNRGLLWDTEEEFNTIWDKYINTDNCSNCNLVFGEHDILKLTKKCMDHDHTNGKFRSILCSYCNLYVFRNI